MPCDSSVRGSFVKVARLLRYSKDRQECLCTSALLLAQIRPVAPLNVAQTLLSVLRRSRPHYDLLMSVSTTASSPSASHMEKRARSISNFAMRSRLRSKKQLRMMTSAP